MHASREEADRRHPRGVRRLLRLALADKLKQARKQLPVPPKLALLYAAIESAAPRTCPATTPIACAPISSKARSPRLRPMTSSDVRDAAAFEARREAIARRLFAEAMERLRQAETILALVADVRAGLEAS